MKWLSILNGLVLIALATIIFTSYKDDGNLQPLPLLGVGVLFLAGIYYIFFNRKNKALLIGNKLMIKRRNKVLKEIEISEIERISIGILDIKIICNSRTELFKFSDFDKESVLKLKSLGANNSKRFTETGKTL